MKKILAILMAICMLVGLLCVSAFAADAPANELPAPAAGTVMRVSALKTNGDTVVIGDYDNFEDGWNDAIELAGSSSTMKTNGYDRIVVDFYTDWKSDTDGNFTDDWFNGPGFDNDTIFITDGARVTLNLNGHTIDRGLTKDRNDGEVIFIDDDADVIINNGTITGAYSNSEGGALYIEGGANVTLNNVNIIGNKVYNDDGAGVYMYGGATLTVNGGTFENNSTDGNNEAMYNGGAVYTKDSTATFNNVVFKNNDCKHKGSAIYADNSDVVVNNCTLDGNKAKYSAVYAEESYVNVTNSTFVNNNSIYMFDLYSTTLVLNSTEFRNNDASYILETRYDNVICVTDSRFTDNNACVMYGAPYGIEEGSFFRNCTFNNTQRATDHNGKKTSSFCGEFASVTFYDCSFGNSTFQYAENMVIENSETSDENAVISITLLQKDGTKKTVPHTSFDLGWDLAMEAAKTNSYDRIVVDLLGDWNTSTNDYGALIIPENARVTLNMNGHTIDRATTSTLNGEVLYISANADVIINDGTITGGCSNGGAGGIHIKDNARVTLNDVNVVGNTSVGSNGAAIAVYDGAILVMNGGSISDSVLSTIDFLFTLVDIYSYGTLYVEDATATLKGVTINGNRSTDSNIEGVAIYADNSTVTLNDCVVSNNGIPSVNYDYAESIIGGEDSTFVITNTDFTGNGSISSTSDIDYSHLFYLEDSSLTIDGGKITGNKADKLFYFDDSKADLKGVTITDNESVAFDVDNSSAKVTLTECVLGNNSPVKYEEDIRVDTKGTLVLNDCELGDTTFKDKTMVSFSNKAVGSMIGGGSLTMIVAFIALAASVASVVVNVSMNKKKAAPAVANDAEETEEEE